MSTRFRFYNAIFILLLLTTGPFIVAAAVLWYDTGPEGQEILSEILGPHIPMGGLLTAIAFFAGVAVVRQLFKEYVSGLMQMNEQLRLMLTANRGFRIIPSGPAEVRLLAEAANALASQRDELHAEMEDRIERANATVEEEKNRLAALMSELSQSIVVCNMDGRIILYNHRARIQFKALAESAGGAYIGLGRSIFSLFDRSQIYHALEHMQHRLRQQGSERVVKFVTTTPTGQLLRVNMAPVLHSVESGEIQMTGYVLSLENITRQFERESSRDLFIHQLTKDGKTSLASMRMAVDNLLDSTEMDADLKEKFVRVIADEVKNINGRFDHLIHNYADSLKQRWPLEEVQGADVLAAAQRRIENHLALMVKTEEVDSELWVKADTFSLVQAMTYIANRVKDEWDVREVRLRLTSEGQKAFFDIIWAGVSVSSETIYGWELDAMSTAGESSPLTLRDVRERHGGEFQFEREKTRHRVYFRFCIPVAPPQESFDSTLLIRSEGRPEYYDFDLFHIQGESHLLDERKLSELTYTTFDTETTGLDPSRGDEIIQIGAVRIVNSRLLRHESFDSFVDPGFPLSPVSTEIHGITDAMLDGQPEIGKVLPQFHRFCEDTVLVAHNAAFDMRFLQMKELATGVKFTQPVLDTLLLSTLIHPNQESHKLEDIAERLGVSVVGRHTALGDAMVTGEVFLRMIPLLESIGIRTLKQAREASEKTYYARIQY